jgi:hypothetical protein
MKLDNGPTLDSIALGRTFEHVFKMNAESRARGESGTAVCLWGSHGIGKTQLVRDFAESRGWGFAAISPAQFEEMNDFHGLPVAAPSTVEGEAPRTVYATPEWVPRGKGPGILLLDDFNRADLRIFRGLMQLLQDFRLFSWSLPEGWEIVLTANPDTAEYAVTSMDPAMLSRLLHFTMAWDPKAWALWAASAGIDRRCIDFVLLNPELCSSSGRTTPRSLVQFFRLLDFADYAAHRDEILVMGSSCLDEETVQGFLAFAIEDLPSLVSPEELLTAPDPMPVFARLEGLVYEDGVIFRADRLATIMTRIYLALLFNYVEPSAVRKENLVLFLLSNMMTADHRMAFWRDIASSGRKDLKELLADPRLAMTIAG